MAEKINKQTMSISILDLLPVLAGSPMQQINWFQQKGLLASSMNCPLCGTAMITQIRNDIQDKYRHRRLQARVTNWNSAILLFTIIYDEPRSSFQHGTFYIERDLSSQLWDKLDDLVIRFAKTHSNSKIVLL